MYSGYPTNPLSPGQICISPQVQYIQNESDHHCFTNMLCISPTVFQILLDLIREYPIFYNCSNNPQTPVQTQLAVTLYPMGHYGNRASLEDIAHIAGISKGSVELFTKRYFEAIEFLHDAFVHLPTAEEKEFEKA